MATVEFNTPILFMVFNRPAVTRKVFEQIRNIRPKHLYVAADGPRKDRVSESEKCAEVRAIASAVDWPCTLKTLFREENIGCKLAVSGNIDWFFQHVESGIILEDDCLPSISFFHFCENILDRYQHDARVVHINGNNFNRNITGRSGFSYHFTYFSQVWGWATWRRAWARYDRTISLFPHFDDPSFFAHAGIDARDYAVLRKKWNNVMNGRIDTWDYQWHFINMLEAALSVVPVINLVSNIGFGADATHTHDEQSDKNELDRFEFEGPIHHPPCLFVDERMNQMYKRQMIREPKLNKVMRRLTRFATR